MKHAAMLLKYHTYLLYNVEIDLISKKSYEAIMYLLESIDTRVTENFFKEISATVSYGTVNIYNRFISKMNEKQF